ncbi:MFS transporter [Streptomyces palmae]|uniref:DHA2 family efflux MFS transporter permease subunit n=1 Tax=Streptomyces palmae TaxID=1701085 RepID=A0A4Z0HCI7_9ACTN|nr:MFS transporter [Streptomyces palmae]TGB14678.1 DHA2 family efflux MFS transporter permease subunit [Streptomyces palmae]
MRKWWPLAAIGLGAFMLLVDVTIVNVALPEMANDLDASFTDLQWVMDVYALALAALLLGAGIAADRLGHRRVYLIGLVVFAAASLGCALAPSAGLLITARAIQGVGAAAMFATTIALLSTTYQGRDRAVAFGAWGAINGAAAASGPILGGLLTEHFGWPWVFAVNVPVAVLAVLITRRTVAPGAGRERRLDIPGMATFTLAIAALTFGLIRTNEADWSDPTVWGPLLGAAVSLAAFVAIELRTAEPMLDLGLFRHRAFVGFLTGGALLSIAAWAMFPYASLWMQKVLGLGPVATGLVIMPMSLVSFVVPLIMSRYGQRVPARWSVSLGLLAIGVGGLLQARVGAGSEETVLVPGMLLIGLGAGLALPPLSSAAMATVPAERAGMAGGTLNTARQLGFALGVAVLGTVFSNRLPHGMAGASGADVAAALHRSYLVSGAIGLAGAVLVWLLVRTPSGHGDQAAEDRPAGAGAEPLAAPDGQNRQRV